MQLRYFHILCTDGDKVRYAGRFQCKTRAEAFRLMRNKVGRERLWGLSYTITEIPIDLLREIVTAIVKHKPIPFGDIVIDDKKTLPEPPPETFAEVNEYTWNGNAPKKETIRRRLGDFLDKK